MKSWKGLKAWIVFCLFVWRNWMIENEHDSYEMKQLESFHLHNIMGKS